MKTRLSILLCLFIAVMVIGCRSRSPKVVTVTLTDVPDIVKLHRTMSATGVPVNMDYQHPREFTEETIRSEVGLLEVMKHKWGKHGMGSNWAGTPVFTQATTEQLVPALVAAFGKASRSDRLVFEVPGRGEKPTRGETYLKDGKLVWVFQEIDGMTYLGEMPYRLDSEDWRIEEKAGMSVRNNEQTQTVRVERDLGVTPADIEPQVAREKAPEPAPEPKQVPEEAVSSSMDQLDKKLETLKEWKDEGLITDEEYAKEKTRIIEKLHGL
jgi:hypothetical protein